MIRTSGAQHANVNLSANARTQTDQPKLDCANQTGRLERLIVSRMQGTTEAPAIGITSL